MSLIGAPVSAFRATRFNQDSDILPSMAKTATRLTRDIGLNIPVVSSAMDTVTEADMANWTVEDLRPYVRHVVEMFGYDRLMFGSDWPVCLLAASYDEVVASTLVAAGDMSAEHRARLMGLNAIDFYGLDV